MATDTNFVATGPGNVGVEAQGNLKVGVEATGTSAGGSFHLPASTTAGPSAVTADNLLCNSALCKIGRHLPTRELFGIAVFGHSDKGTGIMGESDSGTAVSAQSNSGAAIFATSVSERGIHGQSGSGPGVQGQTDTGVGVLGIATSGGGLAGKFQGNVEVTSNDNQKVLHVFNTGGGAAIFADGTSGGGLAASSVHDVGVHSANHSETETAIFGINDTPGKTVPDGAKAGAGSGVWGHTRVERGAGIVGSVEPGLKEAAGVVGLGPTAGRFFGDVEVTGKITVDGDILMSNRDVAEQFGAVGKYSPGSVMVVGEHALLEPCAHEYDKRAVGIISGAGPLRPAITLGHLESETPAVSIAMIGTTFCLVDAEKAPIEVGDLLTSSATLGHAMKATDHVRSFGAVVGKALAPLPRGRGLIPVVVALQ